MTMLDKMRNEDEITWTGSSDGYCEEAKKVEGENGGL